MGAQISPPTAEINELNNYFKKLKSNVVIMINVNSTLVEQLAQSEGQCQENGLYQR